MICRHFRFFWGIKAGNRDTKGYFCSRFVDKFTKYKIQKLVGARLQNAFFCDHMNYKIQNAVPGTRARTRLLACAA